MYPTLLSLLLFGKGLSYMKDNADLARAWLEKSDSDLNTARWITGGPGPFDTACFHAQQAAEKALKAFLAYNKGPIPRTHDLDELQCLCLEFHDSREISELDLAQLTDYAVASRYDLEFWPGLDAALEAIAIAEKVVQLVRRFLPLE